MRQKKTEPKPTELERFLRDQSALQATLSDVRLNFNAARRIVTSQEDAEQFKAALAETHRMYRDYIHTIRIAYQGLAPYVEEK